MKPTFTYISDITGNEYPDYHTMKEAEPGIADDNGLHYKCKRLGDDEDGYDAVIV